MKKSELVRKYEETIYAIVATEEVLNDLRPNRYPYTKSQWEEETTSVYFGDGTSLKTLIESNRITGVINVSLQCE